MPLSCFLNRPKFSKEAAAYLENSCKAPKAMKLDPPLPAGYTAWIHRAGWVLYVHDSSKTCSWMHPGKLARLEARGLKGPGKIGPEMHIWEPNVNRGGYYVIDYGYPPWGKIRMVMQPTPVDFLDIDRRGFKAWEADRKLAWDVHAENMWEKVKSGAILLEEKKTLPKEFWEMRRKVMREQGIIAGEEEEVKEEEVKEESVLED